MPRIFPALLALLCGAPQALAQPSDDAAWPQKPIRWVVPYAAGGLPDTIARLTGQKVGDALGKQVIVENRGGAGGISGSEAVAHAAPDGYTFLIADVGQVAVNQFLYARLPYDPAKDFTPVSLIATSTLLLVANAAVPAGNFSELVSYAKSHPGQLNYGSSGVGSIMHVAIEYMKSSLGLDIVHVPYKGTGEAIPALVGGQVSLVYAALPSIEAHIKAGRVKVLAASTAKRATRAPDVPTVAEAAIPGYDFAPLIGLLAPAGTPPAIVARLAREINKAVNVPEVAQRFAQLDIDAVGSTPEEYGARIRSAVAKYEQAVKISGARIDN